MNLLSMLLGLVGAALFFFANVLGFFGPPKLPIDAHATEYYRIGELRNFGMGLMVVAIGIKIMSS